MSGTLAAVARTITSERNVYSFRLWDWIPNPFVHFYHRSWAKHIPNILTFIRLILSGPVVAWLIVAEHSGPVAPLVAAGLLLAVIGLRLTDVFDGRVARDLKTVSDLGCKLDPLADGILGFGLAAAVLTVLPRLANPYLVALFMAVVLLRVVLDSVVMTVRVRESRRGILPLANKWGKLKYNLDYGLLWLAHAGILFHVAVPGLLHALLLIAVAIMPLTGYFGWKNYREHLKRLNSAV